MKPKVKRKLVKCKRKPCKNIIDVNHIRKIYKGTITKDSLKKLEGYCTITCQGWDENYIREEAKRMKEAKIKAKAIMMDGAFAVFSSLMDLIRKDNMTESLLNRINKEIEKAK